MDTKTGFIFLLYTRNIKNRHNLRVKNWEEIVQANGTKEQSSIVLLISNKKDFKPKIIKRDGEEHYTHIKRKFQDGISILINFCASNTLTLTFIKETLIQTKSLINHHTLIVGDFNTHLSTMERLSK